MSFSTLLFGKSGSAGTDAQTRQGVIDTEYQGQIDQALSPYDDLSDLNAAKAAQGQLVQGLQDYDPNQYKLGSVNLNPGNALGDVDKFLDPSLDYQAKMATKNVESSQAGQGGLFSGAAGQEIADATRAVGEQGWGQAYDRASGALQNSNNAVVQQQNANINTATHNNGLDQAKLATTGQAFTTLMEPINTMSQGKIDVANTMYGSQSGMNQQRMQGQYADKGYFGDLLSAGAKIWGA